MKKKILLMLFPLLAMSLTACDKGNPDPDPAPVEKVVDSIVVKTQPTKTTYNAGESFDSSGMVLTVNYVGGTSEDITRGWTVTPAGILNESDTKVTITYGGKSVDVAITVNGDTPTPATGMKAAYEAAEKLTSDQQTEPFEFGGVVVGKRAQTNEYFIQDGAYGIDIFQPSEEYASKLVLGKKVKVTSTLQNFNGLIETKTISSIAEDGDGTMPQPAVVTSGAELDALKTNVLVNASVVVPQAPTYDASKDLKLTVVLGSDETTLFIKKADVATHEQFIKSLTEGCTINVTNAVVGCYKTKQIVVLDGTQLEKGSGPVQPVLSLDKTTATIEVDGTVTVNATVLNTEDPVVWTIDNEAVGRLSASGKAATVTGLAKGTVTLKAAVASLEKSCVITVNEKGQGTNYGTEDNPISISEAVAILEAECVNSGDYTKQAITAIGEVKTIRNIHSYESGPCFEMDLTDGSKDVYLYRCHATEAQAANIIVGSTVKFVGSAKNHYGTLEFVDSNSGQCHVLSATATTEPTLTLKETETVKVGANVVLTATVLNTENAVEWSLLGDSGSYASITPNGNSVTVRGIAKGLAKVKAAIPADNLEAVCEVTVEEDVHVDVDVDYSFSALEKKDSPAMTNDEAKAAFVNGLTSGTDIVSSVTVSNTYAVAASIRVASKNGGGSLVIATTEKVTKVVVTAHGYSSTELNKISIGTEEVTVKADADKYVFEVTATQSITINADKRVLIDGIGFVTEAKREIEKIEIVGTLAKDTYFVGDTFDPTGLSLKVTYKEGDPETLTSGFTFTVDTLTEEGVINVYAEYKDERSENSVQITVNKVELVSMEIVVDSETVKKNYVDGDAWSSQGISVKGHYNNGSEATLNAEDYELSYLPTAPAIGVTEVEVTATHKTVDLPPATTKITGIVVTTEAQPALDYIEITQNPTKTEYNEGEQFIPEGLEISAHYTLGKSPETKVWGDDGLTYDAPEQFTPTAKTVTIKYTEDGETRTKDLDVTVIPKAESSIKEAYLAGEALSNGGATSQSYTFSGVIVEMRHGTSSDYEYYVQDGEYGMLVFSKGAAISGFAVGKKVQVTSTIQKYSGTIETKAISSSSVIGDAPVPSSTEITSTAVLESTKQNVRANITGVVSAKTNFGTNNDETLSLTVGSDTIKVFIKKTLYSQFGTTVESINVGDTITISDGVRGIYTNNSNVTTHQVLVCDTSSLSKYVPEVTGVSISGDFSKKSYNIGNDWDVSGLVFIGTTKDGNITLNKNDFDFSFNPEKASTIGQNQSVEVTATYKAKPELNASITINGIEVKQSQGELEEVYSFLTKDYAGENNQYGSSANIECGDVTWNFTGNSEQLPWRFGGKNISSGADRPLYSLNPISTTKEISTAIVSIGETGGNCTFTSMSFEVYSTADGAKNGTASALVESFNVSSPSASTDYTFEATEVNSWKGMYIRVVFSVKVSGNSNKYYQLLGLTFKGIN